MYCDGSITIMWSLNAFINDFSQVCQVNRVRPVHSLKVFQLSSDVNCHPPYPTVLQII